VTDTRAAHEYEFRCGRWLAKDEDDGAISRELLCDGEIRNNELKKCVLPHSRMFTESGRAEVSSLKCFCKSSTLIHSLLFCILYSNDHGPPDMLCCADPLSSGLGSRGGSTYVVHVETGDKTSAGTSANVHCILHGKKGDSGQIRLESSSKNFSRGRTDKFTLECASLGPLTHITIGHDNSVRRERETQRPLNLFGMLSCVFISSFHLLQQLIVELLY
jgi:hypothetical protein